MKKYLLLLLITFKILAQDVPISESNYFTYDKYSFKQDLNNVHYIKQACNGEVLVSEYSGSSYKINNIKIQKAIPELLQKTVLLQSHFVLLNGLEYYFTNHKLLIVKDKKIVRIIILNSQNDHSLGFQKLNNTIYFITRLRNGKSILRSFDGGKVENLLSIKTDDNHFQHQLFITDKIYIVEYENNQFRILNYENGALNLKKSILKNTDELLFINNFQNINNFNGFSKTRLFNCMEGKITFYAQKTAPLTPVFHSQLYNFSGVNESNIYNLKPDGIHFLYNYTFNSKYFNSNYNSFSNSYYTATGTDFLRFFPHIKKYPTLFNNSNSNEVFSLTQDIQGNIWAGSYQGALSVIKRNQISQSKKNTIMFMNGGLAYKDKMMLFGESGKGALLYSDPNQFKSLTTDVTFFYGTISKNNKLYLGSSNQGLWVTDVSNLNKNTEINWTKITKKEGLGLYNILTINEDKFGNIWMGRSGQGIAVYNPKTKKAITWLTENKAIDFSSMCSLVDNKNTLWFGKNNGGLCYYDGKNETDYNVKNFKSIEHPLLQSEGGVSFIKQWNDYLILGVKDKILLFNLKKWYISKTVSVRYLNAMETNFTNETEQNTCLVDKRDESVWFATTDMVYQWDVRKWLSLPTFKVIPKIRINKGSIENEFTTKKLIEFDPTENSFDLQINYQTKDNMPRYLNGVLVKRGVKPNYENPNLETLFHFSNLSSGDYVFYIRVCQQDGSYDIFEYPITINKFFWERWWFWLLISSIPISIIVFYFDRKRKIEQQKKQLSQLNLSSLSNQFRPHFMLNALNSIGSQMEDKPHAEKVISRLGESINILYGFTQKNEFTHIFQNEWKLVENIIEIQRLLFIPDLAVTITGLELMDENYKIPIGLIQIPIENALLHGLRNKETKPYNLNIVFSENLNYYSLTIKDNGVGRDLASQMNNFKKNGNGLKTVYEMIKIINNIHTNAIIFNISDLDNNLGTYVIIELKKDIDYDKIKL